MMRLYENKFSLATAKKNHLMGLSHCQYVTERSIVPSIFRLADRILRGFCFLGGVCVWGLCFLESLCFLGGLPLRGLRFLGSLCFVGGLHFRGVFSLCSWLSRHLVLLFQINEMHNYGFVLTVIFFCLRLHLDCMCDVLVHELSSSHLK